MAGYTLFLFIVGLWPFNFTEKNETRIVPGGGLTIARPGTVYTAAISEKLHNLSQFTIFIDLTSASNGLSGFEKIIGYFNNQKDMNFIVGQWKDVVVLHLPDYKRQKEIHFGADDLLKKDERVRFLINFDGMKLSLYRDGKARRFRETGALTFGGWSRDYPLVLGTDADGKGQWKGCIYQVALWDRALPSREMDAMASGQWPVTRDAAKRRGKTGIGLPEGKAIQQENPPVSPFFKGGEDDGRPLVHYVFEPENTYETVFRGKRAVGVRDLGKGEPADLVVPEYFEPYERAFLKWDPDWIDYKSNWLDTAVNIIGFIPLGILALLSQRSRQQRSQQSTAPGQENPPQSPFTKGGGSGGDLFFKGAGIRTRRDAVLAVATAVLAGLVLSIAIEYLQAYLPSRDSSLRDLITNGMGAFIGAGVGAYLINRVGISGQWTVDSGQ